jgi:hypothetical protein
MLSSHQEGASYGYDNWSVQQSTKKVLAAIYYLEGVWEFQKEAQLCACNTTHVCYLLLNARKALDMEVSRRFCQ